MCAAPDASERLHAVAREGEEPPDPGELLPEGVALLGSAEEVGPVHVCGKSGGFRPKIEWPSMASTNNVYIYIYILTP